MSIQEHIKQHLNCEVVSKQFVGTGLFIAYKVTLENGNRVFIKYQLCASQQLIHESKELSLLGSIVHTPKVLSSCEYCLILEWVDVTHNLNLQA